ncbi:tagatose-bisphosphate aldolase [Vagococcus acidifermentans]|uniref:Tagatose 1,6-diphosphate aldolase n=1 Tax=Vagococcus acidifermentans TaxID=564710 RepID=A0A430B390_9ENTE|nr:tagatose-bisphosphate aldolase [Vagococcus acidifermentans]RSU14662.1 tagatose-bisphosphate aldolase [Vagococcus acidifermentans]
MDEIKQCKMAKLANGNGVIAALAIDQRGALRKMFSRENYTGDVDGAAKQFKQLVSEELTPYASAILLDPEYGLAAADARSENAGLLIAYEQTGYDASEPGRFPDLLHDWSVQRIKAQGADAVKFLLYYDEAEGYDINDRKHAFVERIGSECAAEQMPFYLELLSYDASITDNSSKEFAKIKPEKVIRMMREFSKPQYHVDVLKVEVPVNMAYVEGFANSVADVVFSAEEAKAYFKEQSEATHLPFIFLSAGVSSELFQKTLLFAHEAGSTFNGVLCGRSTWQGAVPVFINEGEAAARDWLRTQGKANIEQLNAVLDKTAGSWKDR